jgi:hypothetical protein
MSASTVAILIGAFGAFLQELLFWYDARTRLTAAKYRALLKSAGYWVVTPLVIACSGVGSWLWFEPNVQSARTYLLIGAAFPIVFKKVVAAFVPKATKLGAQRETERVTAVDYLGLA